MSALTLLVHTYQANPDHTCYMLCNTFGILKICRNLPNTTLLLYIRTDAVYDYGIFILTFI